MTRTACGFGDTDDPQHAEGCLSCQSVLRRERVVHRIKTGLPYGWWKNPDTFAMLVWLACCVALAVLVLAWGVDWKPWW